MRSMLMFMGVILHAARPFGDGPAWLVNDPRRNHFFGELANAIHFFRMPAFFVVAGYFSMLLLTHPPGGGFLRERLRRIGIPLVSTLLTFNLVQTWWLGRGDGSESISWRLLEARWLGGSVLGHLWFLVDLLVFCLLLSLAASPVRRLLARARPAWWSTSRGLWLLLAGAMAFSFLSLVSQHLFPGLLDREYLGLVYPSEMLGYLPYFCVGMALQSDEEMLADFSSPSLGTLLLAVAAGMALAIPVEADGIAGKSARAMAALLLTWMLIRLILAVFRRYADKPSPAFRYLSDASYSVYLVHHVIVVVLASWLVLLPWWVGYKFLLTCVVALVASLAIHHCLILRSPLLRYLFNGKPRKPGMPDLPAVPGTGLGDAGV